MSYENVFTPANEMSFPATPCNNYREPNTPYDYRGSWDGLLGASPASPNQSEPEPPVPEARGAQPTGMSDPTQIMEAIVLEPYTGNQGGDGGSETTKPKRGTSSGRPLVKKTTSFRPIKPPKFIPERTVRGKSLTELRQDDAQWAEKKNNLNQELQQCHLMDTEIQLWRDIQEIERRRIMCFYTALGREHEEIQASVQVYQHGMQIAETMKRGVAIGVVQQSQLNTAMSSLAYERQCLDNKTRTFNMRRQSANSVEQQWREKNARIDGMEQENKKKKDNISKEIQSCTNEINRIHGKLVSNSAGLSAH